MRTGPSAGRKKKLYSARNAGIIFLRPEYIKTIQTVACLSTHIYYISCNTLCKSFKIQCYRQGLRANFFPSEIVPKLQPGNVLKENGSLGLTIIFGSSFFLDLDMYMNAPPDQWHRVARMYNNPRWKLLLEAMMSSRYFPILGYLILFPDSLLANVAKAVKEYTMVSSTFGDIGVVKLFKGVARSKQLQYTYCKTHSTHARTHKTWITSIYGIL